MKLFTSLKTKRRKYVIRISVLSHIKNNYYFLIHDRSETHCSASYASVASYVSLGERGAICANINLLYRQPRHAAGKSDHEGESHLVNFWFLRHLVWVLYRRGPPQPCTFTCLQSAVTVSQTNKFLRLKRHWRMESWTYVWFGLLKIC